MDYANGVLDNLPYSSYKPLQQIQNRSAKLVLLRSTYDSTTQALKELHWLPVPERVRFKTLCVAHKCVYGTAPQYLQDMFKTKEISRYPLRSRSSLQYEIPHTKCKTYGDRAFSVNGPKQWNNLPLEIKDNQDFKNFKKSLKTFLFKKVFQ